MSFYFNILALRVVLYIYCVSQKLAKCALITMYFFLLPLLTALTITGTYLFSQIKQEDPDCYAPETSPWSLVMCLCIGWFLTYIYILLGCTALYKKLETTRLRFFFSLYTHISRNDRLLIRLTQNEDEEEDL